MKLHRNLAVIEVTDAAILDAIQAAAPRKGRFLRRISPTSAAVLISHVESLEADLRNLGYAPRVIEM
jgi:threonine synthase